LRSFTPKAEDRKKVIASSGSSSTDSSIRRLTAEQLEVESESHLSAYLYLSNSPPSASSASLTTRGNGHGNSNGSVRYITTPTVQPPGLSPLTYKQMSISQVEFSKTIILTPDVKDPKGEKVAAELKKKNPNALFLIGRSKNLNVVVYEANRDAKNSNALASDNPIDVYWLDLDPATRADNRKKGQKHDRAELNWIEKSMAYGASATATKNKPGTFDVTLVSVPDRAITLSIDPKDSRPKAYITLKKTAQATAVVCVLERIYVDSSEGWLGPTVNYIEIFGTAVATAEQICERVVKK